MLYNKVEICGINTNDIKVLKESEKWNCSVKRETVTKKQEKIS